MSDIVRRPSARATRPAEGATGKDYDGAITRAKVEVCDAYRLWLATPKRRERAIVSAALERLRLLEDRSAG